MNHTLVRVLGPVDIRRGDATTVSIRSSGRRRLLAALVVRRGEVASAEWLADQLGSTPTALRTLVCRLRTQVGPELLVTHHPGYSLAAEACDVAAAERLLDLAAQSEPVQALRLIDAALTTWRGASFAEFADEPFARGEAMRLDERRAQAIEDRADTLLRLGRSSDAIGSLQAHIVNRPLRDRPRRLLMTALADVGRTTEALRVYQDYRLFLAEEFGAEPPATTRELERVIAAGVMPLTPSSVS